MNVDYSSNTPGGRSTESSVACCIWLNQSRGEPPGKDFPPDSDIMGDIVNGSKAAERLEFEIFTRLAAHTEIASD